ncbi:MAG: hypothetical protein RL065_1806 [Bacteroidota bacterium]|jgi:hypothetical protein
MIKNIFDKAVTEEVIGRINKLNSDSKPLWGKMAVGQMLAHCSVSYEYIFEPTKYPKPNPVLKFIIKLMAKDTVVGDKPYPKNLRTGPDFVMKDDKDFYFEKQRLIDFINNTQQLGEAHFDNKESQSFGVLSKQQWNTMFYKHLDHHLSQFGV